MLAMTQPPEDMSQEEVDAFHGHLASFVKRINGLPYHIRQALGMQTESMSSQVIGDLISQSEDRIDQEIASAEQRNDENTATQVAALKALKVTIPYHYTLGQKDEVWLNDQINAIIGTPNISDKTQADAIGAEADKTNSELATESSTTHEDLTVTAKTAPQEA
jgi:hypothetical protein